MVSADGSWFELCKRKGRQYIGGRSYCTCCASVIIRPFVLITSDPVESTVAGALAFFSYVLYLHCHSVRGK
jgi:hypothetical protein